MKSVETARHEQSRPAAVAAPSASPPVASRALSLLLAAVLVIATWTAFAPAIDNGFVTLDDPIYVTENPHVRQGLSPETIAWAFAPTTNVAANWHPLTLLSHLADVSLFGLDPSGHHKTSVLLHVANTLLLFVLLLRMTGSLWCSFAAAALFGLHPLRVESVAWVSERKDVLSGLFALLTVAIYLRTTQTRSRMSRILLVCVFGAGLMTKSMLVTLPCALLLFDFWPLRRMPASFATASARAIVARRVLEKAPLFALSAGMCLVAIVAQQRGGALAGAAELPAAIRLQNAVVAYATYLRKFFWPTDLAAFYPHSGQELPMAQVAAALLLLAGISVFVFRLRERAPYLLVGWLLFAGLLVPVIGLVQVGDQALADRYTYLPSIGLAIAIVWGLAAIGDRLPVRLRRLGAFGGVALLALLATLTTRQIPSWHSGVTLFERALSVSGSHALIHDGLGRAYAEQGRMEDAVAQHVLAVELAPTNAIALQDLGGALIGSGQAEEAVAPLREALRRNPQLPLAATNLGAALERSGRVAEAESTYRRAVERKPSNDKARLNLALLVARSGRYDQSIEIFREVIAWRPDSAEAHAQMGTALLFVGRLRDAEQAYRTAVALEPNHPSAGPNLRQLLQQSAPSG